MYTHTQIYIHAHACMQAVLGRTNLLDAYHKACNRLSNALEAERKAAGEFVRLCFMVCNIW